MLDYLLRRYLEQNGFTSTQDPITMEQGVELEKLRAMYGSPDQFRREVLAWEAEQKKKERKTILDKLQDERNEKFYSGEKTAEQITLAKGRQAQKSNLELARIKQQFDLLEIARKEQRIRALAQQREMERQQIIENRRAEYKMPAEPQAARNVDFVEFYRERLGGSLPVEQPKPKEIEIPMAPPSGKRKIKLRD